jgi:hypothetical protein
MPWIKNVCVDAVCGSALGIAKGMFGISLFTADEAQEIVSLKKLALSVIEKSPSIVSEPLMCEAMKAGQQSALETFSRTATPEIVAAGVVTAAELVCGKALKQRFSEVLMGACLNLVGC